MKKQLILYVILDSKDNVYVQKYLSKVESLTKINQNTLSKHFSTHNKPYKNEFWTVCKTNNVDLRSFNRGNVNNFINS
jgi:hypothetical protein